MKYKIEKIVINTKFISRIYITDKSKWLVEGRYVGVVNSNAEPPAVTICFSDGHCETWLKNYNGYEQALKLYELFFEEAQ